MQSNRRRLRNVRARELPLQLLQLAMLVLPFTGYFNPPCGIMQPAEDFPLINLRINRYTSYTIVLQCCNTAAGKHPTESENGPNCRQG